MGEYRPVRYKRLGQQDYAYKIWNEKNDKTGKWIQRSQYLGVAVDKERGIYEKRNEIKRAQKLADLKEQRILDYGDSYFMSEFLKQDPILPVLKEAFGKYTDTLLSLVLFKLQGGSAMRHGEVGYEGNAANIIFPDASMTTQSISNFLSILGQEKLQQSFFKAYLTRLSAKNQA